MNIIIAGAGEVGRYAVTVLAEEGHHVTLIDLHEERLTLLGEALDIRTLAGSATHADVLREAGANRADLFVAATSLDEINLLAASIAKALGAARTVARVHHSAYHDNRGMNYGAHFGIDRLLCPEYLTSLAIVGVLRDPAVHAIEHFARGQIIMERLEISDRAEVIGKPLKDLGMPAGLRLGTVIREGRAVVPTADTVLKAGDQVTLVGTTALFEQALPKFRRGELHQRKVVIVGGSSTSVWLTRALDPRSFRVRLYVRDRERAEELSEKLSHATVFQSDPTDPDIFDEQNIRQADAFVVLTDDDEDNILGALQAKHLGIEQAVAIISRSTYHQLIQGLGINHVFSPRIVAVREIQRLTQSETVRQIARFDAHGTGVFEITVAAGAEALGQTIAELPLPTGCVLLAIQRGNDVHVPGSRDTVEAGDTVMAVAHEDLVTRLKRLFS